MAPKRTFNIKDKIAQLKMKEEEEAEKKVIDPVTIKIRKFPRDVGEEELRQMMEKEGAVTRVKIPVDE